MKVSVFGTVILALFLPLAAAAAPNPHNSTKCLLCHLEIPRFGVDTRETVTFRGGRSSDDPSLCAFCHKSEENLHPILVVPGPDMLATRPPSFLPLGEKGEFSGKVVCTTCHFYHAAETDHALLRGFPGSQRPGYFQSWQDLCRDCHGNALAERSPHSGDERACAFCHVSRPESGERVEVAPRGAELCNFCHGRLQDRHFAGANPFEGPVQCVTCHGPHLGPDNPARLKSTYVEAARDAVTIDPHYRRSLCFTCHLESDGSPLRSADPVELCNRCHGSGKITAEIHPLRPVPPAITVPDGWPLRQGALTCLTCHRAGHPEDSDGRHFLRGEAAADRNAFCRNCHEAKAYETRNPHLDISAGKGCDFCHSGKPVPGKDNIDTVKLIADPNILCLRCHDAAPHPSETEHTISIPPERASSIPRELPLYKGARIVCATCHNPHIEQVDGHKLRGTSVSMMICSLCHRY